VVTDSWWSFNRVTNLIAVQAARGTVSLAVLNAAEVFNCRLPDGGKMVYLGVGLVAIEDVTA